MNNLSHKNAPHNISDHAGSIIRVFENENTPQAAALGGVSRNADWKMKGAVFRAAGLSTNDQNNYAYLYNFLRKCTPVLRLLFLEYQQWLEKLYASRLLCLIDTVCGMFLNCHVISHYVATVKAGNVPVW